MVRARLLPSFSPLLKPNALSFLSSRRTYKALPSLPLNALLTSSFVGHCLKPTQPEPRPVSVSSTSLWLLFVGRTIFVEHPTHEKHGSSSGRSWWVHCCWVEEEEGGEVEEGMGVHGEKGEWGEEGACVVGCQGRASARRRETERGET